MQDVVLGKARVACLCHCSEDCGTGVAEQSNPQAATARQNKKRFNFQIFIMSAESTRLDAAAAASNAALADVSALVERMRATEAKLGGMLAKTAPTKQKQKQQQKKGEGDGADASTSKGGGKGGAAAATPAAAAESAPVDPVLEAKIASVRSVGEECITDADLRQLLTKKAGGECAGVCA
jgi:cell pole-organizing protein PopZ